MRPVRRGDSPQDLDFEDFRAAFVDLVSRLGRYCSYCGRPILTNLAVEHLQPKDGPDGHPGLEGRWQNFLLACVNCNSTKGKKNVAFADLLFPDRDNTFTAFVYQPDGRIQPAPELDQRLEAIAEATLKLTGLDKEIRQTLDANGRLVARDRSSQRMEAWLIAERARERIGKYPNNLGLREQVVDTAQVTGFFSIWMKVFGDDVEMRNRLIDAFPGTRESGCFDPGTTLPISPAPNPDGLEDGGKI